MRDKLNSLLNRFFVTNFSDLDECGELKVLTSHFFNQWLHSGREHEECLEVLLTFAHEFFLPPGDHFIITLVQVVRNLTDDRVDGIFQVVVNHLISLI